MHLMNCDTIVSNKEMMNTNGEKFSLSKLKYYITDLQVKGKKIPGTWLIDAFGNRMINLPFKKVSGDVSFTVGVPDEANYTGAQEGDLDQLNGMYWTWNSGYILFKMEGYFHENSSNQAKIEYHIGGYKPGENAAVKVKVHLKRTRSPIIIFDLKNLWDSSFSMKKNAVVTKPGATAQMVAKRYAQCFLTHQKK